MQAVLVAQIPACAASMSPPTYALAAASEATAAALHCVKVPAMNRAAAVL